MSEVHPPPADESALAAAVAARICHDLASPLGAVANGIELLLLSGLEPSPELDLVGASVRAASARLALLRLAFGTPAGPDVAPQEVTGPLAALGAGQRLRCAWDVAGALPRSEARLGLLAMLCLETSLPVGGRIALGREGDGWSASAEGPRLRLLPGAWEALAEPRPRAADGAPVPFALLAAALAGAARRLSLESHGDWLALRL